jgi:hypothetical protein
MLSLAAKQDGELIYEETEAHGDASIELVDQGLAKRRDLGSGSGTHEQIVLTNDGRALCGLPLRHSFWERATTWIYARIHFEA